jgi:hypothetical protein
MMVRCEAYDTAVWTLESTHTVDKVQSHHMIVELHFRVTIVELGGVFDGVCTRN